MAVGDIINGIATTGSALSFQPAAGVEVMILIALSHNEWTQLTDGISTAIIYQGGNTDADITSCKIGVTNSVYLSLPAPTGQSASYSGIQIK